MSFGKRSVEKKSEQLVNKPHTRRWMLAVVGVFLALATPAGYLKRHDLAAGFYPAALPMMGVSSNQIANTWSMSAGDPDAAAGTIRWTRCQLARVCQDYDAVKRCQDHDAFAKKMKIDIANPETRPSLHNTFRGTAAEFIRRAERQPSFCNKEYFIADHDGRVASAHYMDVSIERRDLRIKRIARARAAIIRSMENYEKHDRWDVDSEGRVVEDCISRPLK